MTRILILYLFLHARYSSYTTRFPYTTLFRSVPYQQPHLLHSHRLLLPQLSHLKFQQPDELSVLRTVRKCRKFLHESYGDRKSTRLNSSHVAISYAVICLKKKKNINKTTRWRL